MGTVTPVEAIHRSFKSKSHTDYTDCKFCGKSHDKGKCPAYGKVCNNCGCKTTLNQNVDLVAVMDLTQKGLERPEESSLINVASVAIRK